MPTSPNSVDHNLRRDGNEARREDRPEPGAKHKRRENEHNHEHRASLVAVSVVVYRGPAADTSSRSSS
jgi:hypothetical protein